MSGAIWSDEPPAKAGWYWIKSPGERDGHARFFNGEAWAVGEDTECRGCVDGLNKFPTAYQYGPRVPDAETLGDTDELMRRVTEHPPGWTASLPRWSAVGAVFSIGSGRAQALCRRYGQDPDETRWQERGWLAKLEGRDGE